MDYVRAIARVFEHLEEDRLETAVMACLRIARTSKDHLAAATFLRELYPSREEVARVIHDDTSDLKPEAGRFVFERSLDRWIEVHTMDYAFPSSDGDQERRILKVAVGEIEPQLAQWREALADLSPPPGLGSFDAAAFHDAAQRTRPEIRLRLAALNTIKSRLRTLCLNYAIQIEKQLTAQDRNQAFLWSVENDVNNYFKGRDDDVFQKLQKASSLAASADPEDAALLLTEIRRVLKAVADHFYPPVEGLVRCADGKDRAMGGERYLNRLSEYLAITMGQSTARELASAELALLDTFVRRLNDLASKGVHAAVTRLEARQGLVGIFMFLSTVIRQDAAPAGAR